MKAISMSLAGALITITIAGAGAGATPAAAATDAGTVAVRGGGCAINVLNCMRRARPTGRCFTRSVRGLDGRWRKIRVCHPTHRPGH